MSASMTEGRGKARLSQAAGARRGVKWKRGEACWRERAFQAETAWVVVGMTVFLVAGQKPGSKDSNSEAAGDDVRPIVMIRYPSILAPSPNQPPLSHPIISYRSGLRQSLREQQRASDSAAKWKQRAATSSVASIRMAHCIGGAGTGAVWEGRESGWPGWRRRGGKKRRIIGHVNRRRLRTPITAFPHLELCLEETRAV
ncbi:hypothetical protein C8F01DRAFT_1089839 [Mycena amicta]|nr:hypothetical protein C8F01DRAFT_1235916 [Mycena amicta]KAJ7053203.1 hypothetical protein C8F01DRAFT_1089839 [Mycena amicta]